MPLKVEIEKSRHLIVKTAEGHVSFSDVQQSCERMFRDPDFDPSFNMLWDARLATSLDLSSNQVVRIAQNPMLLTNSRVAFVAPEYHVYGVLRMFETYYSMIAQPAQTHVFRDLPEALEWLHEPSPAERMGASQDHENVLPTTRK